jgi:hypothetical protein
MNDISTKIRQVIMITIKANNLSVTGEFWFFLVFRNESELRQIASEMNINIDKL